MKVKRKILNKTIADLKLEVGVLRSKVYELCVHPDSVNSQMIRLETDMVHNLEKAIWGVPTNPKFDGLLSKIDMDK